VLRVNGFLYAFSLEVESISAEEANVVGDDNLQSTVFSENVGIGTVNRKHLLSLADLSHQNPVWNERKH
jgi:hypothetical protein